MTLKKLIRTFAGIAVFLFFALRKGGGFLFVFMVPVFTMVVLYHLFKMVRHSENRVVRGVKVALWVACFIGVGTVQSYWAHESRHAADAAAFAVAAYKSRHGMYPETLRETDVNEIILQEKWGVRYFRREGKPELSYPGSYLPLSSYRYDFEAGRWDESTY
jgi:hypothetical protein